MDRLRQGEMVDDMKTVRRAKDGTEINVIISGSPIFDAQGKVIGISKIVRPVKG